MNSTTLSPVILILIAALVLATGVAVWMYIQKQRTQKLRSKFGPEYDKAIAEHKNRGHAESELQKRSERVAKFHIQPLRAEDRSRYAEDWKREQSRFVDDPRAAVNHADTLVQDVMQRRGYPVGEFDQNARLISRWIILKWWKITALLMKLLFERVTVRVTQRISAKRWSVTASCLKICWSRLQQNLRRYGNDATSNRHQRRARGESTVNSRLGIRQRQFQADGPSDAGT